MINDRDKNDRVKIEPLAILPEEEKDKKDKDDKDKIEKRLEMNNINKANAEIDIDKANKIIKEKDAAIEAWIAYVGKLNDKFASKYDSVRHKLDEANETIKELNIKLEKTNEIIDRLSNMSAPQSVVKQ